MKILTYRDRGYAAFVRRMHRRALPGGEVRELVAGIIDEGFRHVAPKMVLKQLGEEAKPNG